MKTYWYYQIPTFFDRTFEIQIIQQHWTNLFDFLIEICFVGSDHAGPRVEIIILGLTLTVAWGSRKHWDYENNKWDDSP